MPDPSTINDEIDSAKRCESLMRIGDDLSHGGRLDEALEQYISAVDARPNECDSWRRLANCFFRLKRYAEAEDAANQGLEATDDNALHWHLALAIGRQGRPEEALQHLDLLGDHPWSKSPEVYGTRAVFLQRLGRYNEALPFIKRAWRTDKKPWNAYTLAYIYIESGRLRRALRILKLAIKKFEGDKDLHGLYAWALIKRGAYKKAKEEAKRVLEIDATDLYGMRYTIHSVMLGGDAQRAVKVAEEYKTAFPDHDLNYVYGFALRRMGRFREALDVLNAIDPHDDDLPEWSYERGLCFIALGEHQQATEILGQLLRIDAKLGAELGKAIATKTIPR